jgi:predicted nucleic acid-binding protein
MTRYVVDASVAIKWFVDEEVAEEARILLGDDYELAAPDFFLIECGNILWKKVQRAELLIEEARLIRQALEQQPIDLFSGTRLLEPALEIAIDSKCAVYDGCNIAVAMLTDCQLVTADRKLVNALKHGAYAKHLLFVGTLAG